MDFLTTPEQEEIISSSSSFLSARMSTMQTRPRMEHGDALDIKDWVETANLGWFAIGLPESMGGVGFALADEALLLREIGRAIAPGPFISTIIAARVAAHAGETALAEKIMGGEPVGMAILLEGANLIEGCLNGRVELVDNYGADSLVLAITNESAAIIRTADLENVEVLRSVDPATKIQVAEAKHAMPLAHVSESVDNSYRRMLVLATGMLTGIAEATRDLSAEHAKNRVQFDRPIGVHQAIKHPCADMAVQAQLAYSQMIFAALANDEGRPDADFQALSAFVTALGAASDNAYATVQVHGGMGYTWEHDANLYVKRMRVLSHFGGGQGRALQLLLAQPEAL